VALDQKHSTGLSFPSSLLRGCSHGLPSSPNTPTDALKDFEVMILTVRSPMLAAYSLTLAVTSNRWMVLRFGQSSSYPNSSLAAKVMSNLRQVYTPCPMKGISCPRSSPYERTMNGGKNLLMDCIIPGQDGHWRQSWP
jgi:hypothetical protein